MPESRDQLRQALGHLALTDDVDTAHTSVIARARSIRRHRRAFATISLVAIVAGVGAIAATRGGRDRVIAAPATVPVQLGPSASISSSTVFATTSTTSTTAAARTATSTSPSLSNWTTPSNNPDGSIAVANFNTHLDSDHPPWASSPERIANEFLNTDAIDIATVATHVTALSPRAADVVVIADDLRDDSVHAVRYNLRLVRQPDQTWRLTSAAWAQQCQPNRGHQDFTTGLCL
jgi:hypothetical protein